MTGVLARRLFGSANDPCIKSCQPRVFAVNMLEAELATFSDEELRARTNDFKQEPGTPPRSPLSRTNLR